MAKKNFNELITTPFETKIKNFANIAKYFLYYAPNINSAQSNDAITGDDAKAVFESMMKKAGLEKRYKIVKKIQPDIWKSNHFDGEVLDFEDLRFTCDIYKNESELQALLRHLRNALAHGYIYVWRKRTGNYIFFQDFDGKKNKITAKMMLSMDILEKWKAILENEIV